MATVEDNFAFLRQAAYKAGMTEEERLATCSHLVTPSHPSPQQMIDVMDAFSRAQADLREASKRKLLGGG